MKNLLVGMMFMSLSLNSFAQVSSSPMSCQDIYVNEARIAESKRDNYNRKFNKGLNETLGLAGLVGGLVAGVYPVGIVLFVTPAVISTLKNIPKKEERALRLQGEYSSQMKRFVKRMKNNISEDITREEVENILNAGFTSGTFCKDVSNLAGPSEIRRHIESELQSKYGVDAKGNLKQALNNEVCLSNE